MFLSRELLVLLPCCVQIPRLIFLYFLLNLDNMEGPLFHPIDKQASISHRFKFEAILCLVFHELTQYFLTK